MVMCRTISVVREFRKGRRELLRFDPHTGRGKRRRGAEENDTLSEASYWASSRSVTTPKECTGLRH